MQYKDLYDVPGVDAGDIGTFSWWVNQHTSDPTNRGRIDWDTFDVRKAFTAYPIPTDMLTLYFGLALSGRIPVEPAYEAINRWVNDARNLLIPTIPEIANTALSHGDLVSKIADAHGNSLRDYWYVLCGALNQALNPRHTLAKRACACSSLCVYLSSFTAQLEIENGSFSYSKRIDTKIMEFCISQIEEHYDQQ
jgi:hypothetical protein